METVLRNSNNSDQEDSKNEQDAKNSDFLSILQKTEFAEGCDPLHAQQISLCSRNCPSSPQHLLLLNVKNEESLVDIQVGYLYEIDHQVLPPKSPIHLQTVRVVMVTQKTEVNVFVRFPSALSLKRFFSTDTANQKALETSTGSHPELDELFVMSASIAGKILQRIVSFQEFTEQKLFQSFWLLPQKSSDSNINVKKDISEINVHAGDCQTALKYASSLSWGARRKVTHIGKHREIATPPLLKLESSDREENKFSIVSKRLRRNLSRDKKQKKKRKLERSEEKSWPSKDRWSRERYESAEKKMLCIMHSKGAVLGNPILRHELRSEARKHIGDTGLLDHLLKHMDGKVVSGERFRRRHNPDGAMEYWLEGADLMDIRRNAGIHDPFWLPPPGWKPGDDPSCGNHCSMELKKLKEEIAHLKSDLERLLPKANDKEADISEATASETVSGVGDIYNNLMKRKGQLEKQLMDISNSLGTMQEEIKALRNERDDVKNKSRNENISKIKSGFRICKPQGTFLWPTPNNSVISPTTTKIHVEDLVVPTPSSVSSSTSPLLFPTSPVKPIAEKRAVTLTHPHFSQSSERDFWTIVSYNNGQCFSGTTVAESVRNRVLGPTTKEDLVIVPWLSLSTP